MGDREYLWENYSVRGLSIVTLANQLGCAPATVRRALHRHGIEVRPYGRPRIDQLYDTDWLRQARAEARPGEIARMLGCSEVTVRWALWRSGIAPGPGSPNRPKALDDVEFLLREYVQLRRSATSIASELGCATATVTAALRRHGLRVRSSVEQNSSVVGWRAVCHRQAAEGQSIPRPEPHQRGKIECDDAPPEQEFAGEGSLRGGKLALVRKR